MKKHEILSRLPYSEPFLFVDEIVEINENGVVGTYVFRPDADFYRGHFKGNPVTPGVILTETMAQIGVVCLGLFLLNDDVNKVTAMALTSADIEFLNPVYPNEKVVVKSSKIYFRFGKLKCEITMFNSNGIEVCRGTIAGIIK
ncbi:MAG TPA: 3-hydroxyacyl-ACP dehydratase FabZ family protein [Flavobacterium sp.]|jgi:3-hydroxyacyl-[acyl-carrier-protein] dehydratase